MFKINPLNAELNPICHLLALLGAHLIFHVSRIRVKRHVFDFVKKYFALFVLVNQPVWLHAYNLFRTLPSEFASTCQKCCLPCSSNLLATAVVTFLGVLAMSLSFGSSFVTKFIYFYFQMKCLLLDEK
jgi:hypothetical protein